MGHLKPRYYCSLCKKEFTNIRDLQYHRHEVAPKPRLKKATARVASYHCLKCKTRHQEGVVSYIKHMEFKRKSGRPTKK